MTDARRRAARLNAPRRRHRKEQLAARFGSRCAYCHHPFISLREATLDHIVPVSLWRSWSVTSLVLACRPCNHAKADRLPLSLALVLLWTTEVNTTAVAPAFTTAPQVFTEPTDQTTDADPIDGSPPVAVGGSEAIGVELHPDSTPFTLADWKLLARLAYAAQSAGESGHRSTAHLREHREHDHLPREHPLRRSARSRLCTHPPTSVPPTGRDAV